MTNFARFFSQMLQNINNNRGLMQLLASSSTTEAKIDQPSGSGILPAACRCRRSQQRQSSFIIHHLLFTIPLFLFPFSLFSQSPPSTVNRQPSTVAQDTQKLKIETALL
ncbi:MAG TPA: hypothetical protein PK228_06045, partial [Saprospiraceae bacterium]|nr:hypothetical protein [Saprospiraceae bacterium]